MTSLLTRPAPARSELSRIDAEDRRDRMIRLAAGIALWASLLLITYWWVAAGASPTC